MKRSTFMAIAAVLALVYGTVFLLVPAQVMSLYGVTLDLAGQWVARCLGSMFIGIAVLTWLSRHTAQGNALRAIVLGDFVVAATGFIVTLLFKISGLGNALVWSTVAGYFLLTVGFGYFQFVKRASS